MTGASPVLPSASSESDLIVRLRAAGCVFAEEEAGLLIAAASDPADLAAMAARRIAGLPLEQVLGWAEFCGLRIAVDPGVFVPRRRTGLMAGQAVEFARQCLQDGRRPVALDLCCGTGAMAMVLLDALGQDIAVFAADVDPAAVACARRNLGDDRVFQGDLYAALPEQLCGRIDVLVANAPYVPTEEIQLMPREARDHEHLVALDGGDDGLAVVRQVVTGAGRWLAPGGRLLVETSLAQLPMALELFSRNGFTPGVRTSDELGATVVIGTRVENPLAVWPAPGSRG